VFAWVPPEVRRPVVSQLLAISRGHDRMGRMSETAGRQMREELQHRQLRVGADLA